MMLASFVQEFPVVLFKVSRCNVQEERLATVADASVQELGKKTGKAERGVYLFVDDVGKF